MWHATDSMLIICISKQLSHIPHLQQEWAMNMGIQIYNDS